MCIRDRAERESKLNLVATSGPACKTQICDGPRRAVIHRTEATGLVWGANSGAGHRRGHNTHTSAGMGCQYGGRPSRAQHSYDGPRRAALRHLSTAGRTREQAQSRGHLGAGMFPSVHAVRRPSSGRPSALVHRGPNERASSISWPPRGRHHAHARGPKPVLLIVAHLVQTRPWSHWEC